MVLPEQSQGNRLFLVGLLVSSIAVAGCVSQSQFSGDDTTIRLPDQVRSSDRWTRVGFKSQIIQISIPSWSSNLSYNTVKFSDTQFNNRIQEQLLGLVQRNLTRLYITQVDSSSIPEFAEGVVIGNGKLAERAQTKLEQKGNRSGLTFQRVKKQSVVVDGKETLKQVFTADYTYSGRDFQAAGTTFHVPGGSIPIRAVMYVFDCPSHDDRYIISGLYPAAGISESMHENLTNAISVDVSINLAVQPEQRHATVLQTVNAFDC